MFLALTDFSFLSICSTPSYSFSFVSFLVLSDFFFKLNDFKSFFILYVLQIFSFIDIEKMGTITFKQVFSFLSANLFSFLYSPRVQIFSLFQTFHSASSACCQKLQSIEQSPFCMHVYADFFFFFFFFYLFGHKCFKKFLF